MDKTRVAAGQQPLRTPSGSEGADRDNTRDNIHPVHYVQCVRQTSQLGRSGRCWKHLHAPSKGALWTLWSVEVRVLSGALQKAPLAGIFTLDGGCGEGRWATGRCLLARPVLALAGDMANALAPSYREALRARRRDAPGRTADRRATPPRAGPTPAAQACEGLRAVHTPRHEASTAVSPDLGRIPSHSWVATISCIARCRRGLNEP